MGNELPLKRVNFTCVSGDKAQTTHAHWFLLAVVRTPSAWLALGFYASQNAEQFAIDLKGVTVKLFLFRHNIKSKLTTFF